MLIFPFTLNGNLTIIILTQVKFLFLSSSFFNQTSLYYKSALLSFLSMNFLLVGLISVLFKNWIQPKNCGLLHWYHDFFRNVISFTLIPSKTNLRLAKYFLKDTLLFQQPKRVLFFSRLSPILKYYAIILRVQFKLQKKTSFRAILGTNVLIMVHIHGRLFFTFSVQFSYSVMSDSLRHHESHHTRPSLSITNSWSLLKLMSIE